MKRATPKHSEPEEVDEIESGDEQPDTDSTAESAAPEAAPAPQLTRVTRVSGHELADKLRHERRVTRLKEKGY